MYILGNNAWLLVPPVAVRKEVVEECHGLLRHAGINKLVASLRSKFWWSTLVADVGIVVKGSDSC